MSTRSNRWHGPERWAKACQRARSRSSRSTAASRSTASTVDGSGSSCSSSVGSWRPDRRSRARHSLRVVAASQAATRSGSLSRPRCSTSRNHAVWLTSAASAGPRRYERVIDHTSPPNWATRAFHAVWSPPAAASTNAPTPIATTLPMLEEGLMSEKDEYLPPWVKEREGSYDDVYVYHAGHLLADDDPSNVRRVMESLDRWKVEHKAEPLEGLGLVQFFVDPSTNISALVNRLRSRRVFLPMQVAPNHVMTSEGHIHVVGFLGPSPADPLDPLPKGEDLPGYGMKVGLVDSGLWSGHPFFAGRPVSTDHPDGADNDADGRLDPAAGHGTFAAGLCLRAAPGAKVAVARALTGEGFADEVRVAQAMLTLADADIVNISMGGYAHNDMGFTAIAGAMRTMASRNPRQVVVASAGNYSNSRPFFLAAFKRVVAVAALDESGQPACFTNYGWWVDAGAPGVDLHSTFLEWRGPLWPRSREVPIGCPGSKGSKAAEPLQEAAFRGFARWSGTSFAAPQV